MNDGSGIVMFSNCSVRDNRATNQLAANSAGILVIGNGIHIVGNRSAHNYWGFFVSGEHNVIASNSCIVSPNAPIHAPTWFIAANNYHSGISDYINITSPEVLAPDAGATLNFPDPWVNLTYVD